jgi:Cdc6-like AAA superfamily ATPase
MSHNALSTGCTAYSEAKKYLNASAPERVMCRSKESTELKDYLLDCFDHKKSISIYVNGQPGTGKTLLVNHILDTLKVKITCFAIRFELNFDSIYCLKRMKTISSKNWCSTACQLKTFRDYTR